MTEEKKVKKRKVSPATEINDNVDKRHKREQIDTVPSAVKQCVDKNGVATNSNDGDNSESNKQNNYKPEEQLPECNENAFNKDETEVQERKIIVNKFFIQEFRNKILNSDDFITELKDFITALEQDSSAVAKYLTAGGNPIEIVQLLKKIDKSNFTNITLIFNALQLLLVEILTKNSTKFINTGIQACKYLLNNHISAFNDILAAKKRATVSSIMKLLTAVVAVDGTLGEDVLKKIDFFSNNSDIPGMFLKSEKNLRTEYASSKLLIHFYLAYLIDGNPQLIKSIMKRTYIFETVCANLYHESHEVINFFLQNVTKHILLSTNFNREHKLFFFTDNAILSIAELYDWRFSKTLVPKDHKDLVVNATHEFLLLLLTSKKYGIIFPQDNFRQKFIMRKLRFVCMSDKKMELFLQISLVCPDMIKSTLNTIQYGLIPSSKHIFFPSMLFARKFITQFDANKMIRRFEKLNMKDLAILLTDLCLPTTFLQKFKQSYTITTEAVVKIEIVHLLYLMLEQLNKYFEVMKQSNEFKEYAIKRIKFEMLNQILAFFPSFDLILNSLHTSIKSGVETDCNIKRLLDKTLDLLLIILNLYPILIEKSTNVINYLNVLQPIYEFQVNNYDEQNINISLKAIKVILKLEPQIITKDLDIYQRILKTFLNIYVCGNNEKSLEAKVLLKRILLNTGLFEQHNEIDFWLHTFKVIESSTMLTSTIDHFTKFLRNVQKKGLKIQYCQFIDNQLADVHFSDTKTIDDLFKNKTKNEINKIEIPILNNFLPSILQNVKKVKDEHYHNYLNSVVVYLFHYLPYPKVIQQMFAEMENSPVNKYFDKWLVEDKPISLKKYDDTINGVFSKCYMKNKCDFFDGYINLEKQNINKGAAAFKLDEKEVYLDALLEDETQLASLIHMTLFYTSKLIQMKLFSDEYYNTTIYYVKNLLSILHQIEKTRTNVLSETEYDIQDVQDNNVLANILNYIYCSSYTLYQNFDLFDPTDNKSTKLMVELTNFVFENNLAQNNANYKNLYSQKIVQQVIAYLSSESVPTTNITDLFRIIEIFDLNEKNCLELLDYIIQLEGDKFLVKSKEDNFYYEILVYIIQRFTKFTDHIIPNENIEKISTIYNHINGLVTEDNMNLVNFDKLETSLYNYLKIHYFQIANFAKKIFTCTLGTIRKITKPSIKLIVLMFERTDNLLIDEFLLALAKNVSKKEMIFPLLNVAIQNAEFYSKFTKNKVLLNTVYNEYRNGILKTIDKPQKAGVIYKENLIISKKLILLCMPANECIDFAKRNLKTDGMELNQLSLIETIFTMAFEQSLQNIEQQKLIYTNFFQIFIQLFNLVVKKDNLDMMKIKALIYSLSKWINLQTKNEHLMNLNFENIFKSANWNIFAKNCLKHGMKLQLNTKTNKLDQDYGLLLKILAKLCDLFYIDNCKLDDPALFFDMALSHSSCFDIILMKFNNEIKTNLFYLLNILVRKTAVVMDSKHIPLYLSGYNATLSVTDRYILSLIQYYESSGISLYEYRPFLWGETAIKYYNQLHETTTDSKTKLNEININDVIYLINSSRMNLTLNNYPVLRKLNVTDQLPNVCFDNLRNFGELEDVSQFNIIRSRLERIIEHNLDVDDVNLKNKCSKNDDLNDKLYDPAFFIPLIGLIFAPETLLSSATITRTGCISLLFAGLSSYDEQMRLASGYNLQLCRQYIDSSSIMDKDVWSCLFDITQNGLAELKKSATIRTDTVARAPFISSLFLGHTANILPFGSHDMYRTLANYVVLKPVFEFKCVPEFIRTIFSSNTNYNQEREFTLGILNNGLKTFADFELMADSPIIKTIFSYYGAPSSSRVSNLLILSIINTIVRIPSANYNIIKHNMLLVWLNSCIDKLEGFEFDTVDGLINIINNIWFSAKLIAISYQERYKVINFKILLLLIKMLPKLSSKHISLKSLSRFMNILYKTANPKSMGKIPRSLIETLLSFLTDLFPEYVQDINYMYKNGWKGSEDRQTYELKLINDHDLNNEVGFILVISREFVKNWLKKH